MPFHSTLRPQSLAVLFASCWLAFSGACRGEVSPGEILLSEMNCVACHEVAPDIAQRLNSRRSPRLGPDGLSLSRSWVKAFLEQPQTLQPGTLMPDMLHALPQKEKEAAAEALSEYLVSLQMPNPAAPGGAPRSPAAHKDSGEEFAAGAALYHSVGCVACHAPKQLPTGGIKSSEVEDQFEKLRESSVPLGRPAEKFGPNHASEIATFLKDPLGSRPSGRMPACGLTDTEAMSIARYLLNSEVVDTAGPEESVLDPARAARGKELFAQYRCGTCHESGEPGKKARPLARIRARQPVGCLAPAPPAGVPRFELTDRQRVVLLAALGNQSELSAPLTPEQTIRRSMTVLNCYACHSRDRRGGLEGLRRAYFTGMATAELGDESCIPPALSHVGAKLQPEWLAKVLTEGTKVRPAMAARMPQFGPANLQGLAAAFGQADAKAVLPNPPFAGTHDAGLAAEGARLVGKEGLSCLECHGINGQPASRLPGIDLTTVPLRLRPGWFRSFLLDPRSIDSATKMPSLWPDGQSMKKDVLGGNGEKQIAALWVYFSQNSPHGPGKTNP